MTLSVEARALRLLDEALDRPAPEQAAWLQAQIGGDAAARERALELLGADASPIRTGGAPAAAGPHPLPDRIGAYRVIGLIGEGGMGAVYRAERATGDFEHRVAIKLVRPGALSEPLQSRFQGERQTLARLSHPNIARLLDGGETPAGDPYIVMELVDGVPLDRWLAEEPAAAARTRLFLAVCGAVGFAHQHLIVHRDLTPANILVEPDGVPKLIDFGISRPPMAADQGVPEPGGPVTQTPGFAAPEGSAGGSTTLGDIYSLGRLLARIFPAPRDTDLAAIIATATAPAAEHRYPSADALAEDVAAWRDGMPVAARRGGRRYVARRFVARHRLAVGASVVALLLLIGALAAALVANARAERARAQAELRFQQTRAIAKTMMFDVYDSVSVLAGSTDARFLLARTAQHYLDSLAADRDAPADVRLEVGEGLFRLGRVVGFTGGGSLGRRAEGKALLDRAQVTLEVLHAQNPADARVRIALSHLLSVRAGERLYGEDDSATARVEARRARALLTGITLNPRAAGALIGAYLYEGDSLGWDNDIPGAGRVYEAGLAAAAALPPTLRESEEVAVARSGLLRQSADVYRYAGQVEAAVDRMRQAVALNRTLVADSRGSPATVRRLVSSLNSLADLYRVEGQLEAARVTIADGYRLAVDAARASPSDSGGQENVALTGVVLAQVESARGAHGPALAAADRVIAIRRNLLARSGGNKGAAITLAVNLRDVAPVYRAAGQTPRACAALAESVAILSGFARAKGLSEYDRTNTLVPATSALKACPRALSEQLHRR